MLSMIIGLNSELTKIFYNVSVRRVKINKKKKRMK